MKETKPSFYIHSVVIPSLFVYLFIYLFIYLCVYLFPCAYCETGWTIGSSFDWHSVDHQFEYRPRHLL
jgi:hypothetical protein